jgi:hypothetical protein
MLGRMCCSTCGRFKHTLAVLARSCMHMMTPQAVQTALARSASYGCTPSSPVPCIGTHCLQRPVGFAACGSCIAGRIAMGCAGILWCCRIHGRGISALPEQHKRKKAFGCVYVLGKVKPRGLAVHMCSHVKPCFPFAVSKEAAGPCCADIDVASRLRSESCDQ